MVLAKPPVWGRRYRFFLLKTTRLVLWSHFGLVFESYWTRCGLLLEFWSHFCQFWTCVGVILIKLRIHAAVLVHCLECVLEYNSFAVQVLNQFRISCGFGLTGTLTAAE